MKIMSKFKILIILFCVVLTSQCCLFKHKNQENIEKESQSIKTFSFSNEFSKGIPQLKFWIDNWRELDTSFSISSFVSSGPIQKNPLYYHDTLMSDLEYYLSHEHLFVFSDDSTKYIDVFAGYLSIDNKEDTSVSCGADVSVRVVKSKNNEEKVLFTCGPSAGSIHDCFWLNDSTIAILMTEVQEENEIEYSTPLIMVYYLNSDTYEEYISQKRFKGYFSLCSYYEEKIKKGYYYNYR